MFEKFSRASAADRISEEKLYEQVVHELAQGQKRDGLWAKALANSEGIEGKAKALYIQYRVQSIKDEIEISVELAKEAERQAKAAPILERQKRVNKCEALLRSKGYRLKTKRSGWVVIEPLGGKMFLATLEKLEEHAISRQVYKKE